MDPNDLELINRLCTKAGTVMEDASVIAITTDGRQPDRIRAKLAELTNAANIITSLLRAAAAVASDAN